MDDVLIVGAGPAGAVAALVLARAGVRVRLLDRSTFPRHKLCGDTVNPGAMSMLRRLGVSDAIERRGLQIDGMVLTGEGGATVEGRYPDGICGRAIVRRDLDWILLQHAVAAGVDFEPGVAVQQALVGERDGKAAVVGVAVGTHARRLSAPIVIAADGRRSTIAFGLRLARHPSRPRRWAVGAYFENFVPLEITSGSPPDVTRMRPRCSTVLGEMHVRKGRYIGVAALPGGLTNVCLVKPSGPGDADLRNPVALLTRELARDPMLRDRAADARPVARPVVLGPLAVDADCSGPNGLLVAGDAAGFIDPMTGDGLRFAIRGGELAADAALHALEHGWVGLRNRLAAARRHEFRGKWRFNRFLRHLVGSRLALDAAAITGRYAPGIFQRVIAHAGDCSI
jgi:flavin-dependent dehydrogenase